MAKKKIKYYRLYNILKKLAAYNIIYGKRSNGKTFAALEHGIKRFFQEGFKMAYIRRWSDDFKGKRGQKLFAGVVEQGIVEKWSNGLWTDVYYWGGQWYLCRWQTDDQGHRERIKDELPFCYGFSLNAMEHDKGANYPGTKTIILDEFMTRGLYLDDEFVIFMNVLSTIIRNDPENVQIFMLANSVNKYCPYFAEMGINIKDQRPGTIDLYKYGESKLTVAVEYVEPMEGSSKDGNYLFAFDNPKLKMISHGDWEIDIYPHLPERYKHSEVIFDYFIRFDGELLHAEIVAKPGKVFTYIHTKTSDIKDPDHDVVFQQEADPRPNYYTRLDRPVDRVSEKILKFYKKDKVFFQNNEVGEILNNYLKWCRT